MNLITSTRYKQKVKSLASKLIRGMKNRNALIRTLSLASVADLPTFHFDSDADPTFHFVADPVSGFQKRLKPVKKCSNRLIFRKF
jgi:hypothetical protein